MAANKQSTEKSCERTKTFSIERACESPNFVKNLSDIIETHPDENARNFGMSIIHLLSRNYNETLKYLEFLTETHPNISLLHRRIGEVYISQDKFETAAAHLEEALKLEKDFTVLFWLGLIHNKLGNENKANICFDVLKDDVFFLHASNHNWVNEK